MFGNDREQMRRFFTESWRKFKQQQPLQPLEQLIVEVVKKHPEYHALLEIPDKVLDRDYLPEQGETNPFLHLSMHIGLSEQISTDRPAGITALYRQLLEKYQDAHEVEHQLMECLGMMLWEAQRNNTMPDEQKYLECVKSLL
ncbi:MAG: DUF1841 family protein [Chromatiales bacterium]|nr:DUF1841 family protein [Chromatiales bacterium]